MSQQSKRSYLVSAELFSNIYFYTRPNRVIGMFPLPGAPRQQPMDPSRLQAFMNPPSNDTDNAALRPSNSRQAKRLFVYNIPASATEDSIVQFFNLQLNGLNVINGVDPCMSAQISDNHSFALLEFKTPADATVALAFDGISMEDQDDMETTNGDSNGSKEGLDIRRPRDYIVQSASTNQETEEGVVSNEVPDSPNKICVSNIPLYIPEEPVTMLLVSFGELKSFVLVKDQETEQSRVSTFALSNRLIANLYFLGNCILRIF